FIVVENFEAVPVAGGPAFLCFLGFKPWYIDGIEVGKNPQYTRSICGIMAIHAQNGSFGDAAANNNCMAYAGYRMLGRIKGLAGHLIATIHPFLVIRQEFYGGETIVHTGG